MLDDLSRREFLKLGLVGVGILFEGLTDDRKKIFVEDETIVDLRNPNKAREWPRKIHPASPLFSELGRAHNYSGALDVIEQLNYLEYLKRAGWTIPINEDWRSILKKQSTPPALIHPELWKWSNPGFNYWSAEEHCKQSPDGGIDCDIATKENVVSLYTGKITYASPYDMAMLYPVRYPLKEEIRKYSLFFA